MLTTAIKIDAPANVVWRLLIDTHVWPSWGPSVRDVACGDRRVDAKSIGIIETALGIRLPFEITDFEEGSSWSWRVGGVRATSHTLKPLGDGRCELRFGVPFWAIPYLGVCRIALRRIKRLAEAP